MVVYGGNIRVLLLIVALLLRLKAAIVRHICHRCKIKKTYDD
jgi:hypothetical protein